MATETNPRPTYGDPRRSLPAVSVLLELPEIVSLVAEHSRPAVLEAIQDVLAHLRRSLHSGDAAPSPGEVATRVSESLARQSLDRIRPLVNASGVVLHTGLGRAVLPQAAVTALAGLNRCCNLQIDLETGRRGKRNDTSERLLVRLTGAEAAVIVNNNAAATLLILTALCKDREVIVSRGQLIEIGGSFRLPDCVHESGAKLVEVGTTNKTHLRDYESAITEDTAAILRVNPSNYRVVGFSKQVPIAELARLKARRDVLVIDDLGCGALVDMRVFGLPPEPTVPESIAAGADLVCFSGDKLIGGPQAGIIVGRADLVAKVRKHPLTRMLRVGKLTDMALEHTLRLFLHPESLPGTHATLGILTRPLAELQARAERLRLDIERGAPWLEVDLVEANSAVGGGSLPGVALPTRAVTLSAADLSADGLAALLRRNEPPVITRINEDRVVLDVRTMMDGDDEIVVKALARIGSVRA